MFKFVLIIAVETIVNFTIVSVITFFSRNTVKSQVAIIEINK